MSQKHNYNKNENYFYIGHVVFFSIEYVKNILINPKKS